MNSVQDVAMLILGLAVLLVLAVFVFQGIPGMEVSVVDHIENMSTSLVDMSNWFQKNGR